MARHTCMPKIKWLAYTVYIRRKIISRRVVDNHSSGLHYFHYDLCQSGSGIPVYLTPVIPTLSVSMAISASVRFLVLFLSYTFCTLMGVRAYYTPEKLTKTEGLAYENAGNRYPQRTIRPKIDPLAYVGPIPKA